MSDNMVPAVACIRLASGREALIDADDLPIIEGYSWRAAKTQSGACYAKATRRDNWRKSVYLHRLILCAPDGMEVDHVNGDGLDCRRSNLRLCTRAENARNKHRILNAHAYRGVAFHSQSGSWGASIKSAGLESSLGYYATAREAADAYDLAATRLFGEFASPNSPELTSDAKIVAHVEHALKSRLLRSAGVKPVAFQRGERCHQAKLVEADVRTILARRANGETYAAIASAYPVTVGAVQAICLGRTWAHIARGL